MSIRSALENELSQIQRAIDGMKSSSALEEFSDRWVDYLTHTERFCNKIQAAFRTHRRWHSWWGGIKTARRKDPLLKYLKNARDTNDHSISEITGRSGSSFVINSMGRDFHLHELTEAGVRYSTSDPGALRASFTPSRITLVPVTTYGTTYEVPTSHLGERIDPADVISTAMKGFEYYFSVYCSACHFFTDVLDN